MDNALAEKTFQDVVVMNVMYVWDISYIIVHKNYTHKTFLINKQVGHGNPDEGCLACGCNPLGSQSTDCDRVKGQCKCKPGVSGRKCNKCLDLHFGFSKTGCLGNDLHKLQRLSEIQVLKGILNLNRM